MKRDEKVTRMPDAANNSAFTAAGTGKCVTLEGARNVFQASLNAGGTSATIEIHLYLDPDTVPASGTKKITIVLSGSSDTVVTDPVEGPYIYACAKVTQITGSVTVITNGMD